MDAATVTEFTPPEGFGAALFSSVLFFFLCRASLPWVVPGSWGWAAASALFPGGAEWYRYVVGAIFWPTVLIHTAEAVIFERVRLRRYSVPRGSRVWWLWLASCWVEGVTSFKRIDRLAKRGQASKKK
ncbi:hypothetical protein ACO1O0_006419 [Amphichorda felina]